MNMSKTKTLRFLVATIIACTLLATKTAEHAYAYAITAEAGATVTFNGGELTLMNVPSLDFETREIAGVTQEYEMEKEITPIQISDLRGSHAGWRLTVALSGFKKDQAASLHGATLNIATASVTAVNDTVGTSPSKFDPPLEITADNAEFPIFTASEGIGSGVWKMMFNPADVTLKVLPGTASAGANTATLTWTLHDAP